MIRAEHIQIQQLSKLFHQHQQSVLALSDINLSIANHEFVALVGASGCGKSTLLRILSGLEVASQGQVLTNGRPIKTPGRERAMVFQDYALYPWLTVLDNIRCSRQFAAASYRDNDDQIANALERSRALLQLMDLERVRDSYPNQLSGGMRQRVAIARALLSRPQVLLMDEPFGALDAQTREVMHDLLLQIFSVEKNTILFVTHDVEEAIYLAERVVVMAPNPGHIDSIYRVPLPPGHERHQDLKLSKGFIELKKIILDRIRATAAVQMNLGYLKRLNLTECNSEHSAKQPFTQLTDY